MTPRVVVVTRKTDLQRLVIEHATFEQARFFLRTRGQDIGTTEAHHERFIDALNQVVGAIPASWRQARVSRDDVDRFLFEPGDIVLAVGQDGLVANVAKYLDGQMVVGVNPEPERHDGVLVPLAPAQADQRLLRAVAAREASCEARTMVEARLADGQRLLALNELFVGHRTHQSARYRIEHAGAEELHSSSGVVISTGTGATGWARSIHGSRVSRIVLPTPVERRVTFFVREAFPSVATGTAIADGEIADGDQFAMTSRMNEDGVIFGDGIEADRLAFAWGTRATLGIAQERLHLVQC